MASVAYLVKSSLHLLLALALVWCCIHVLFSNVGQYVTPDDLMLPDRMNKKVKGVPVHGYKTKEEWLSWIMDSDSLAQRRLDFVKSNLLRVTPQDTVQGQSGSTSLQFSSCTFNQPSAGDQIVIAAGLKALYESTEQVTVLVLSVLDLSKLAIYTRAGNLPPLYTVLLLEWLDPLTKQAELNTLLDLPYLPHNTLYLHSEMALMLYHGVTQRALTLYTRALLVACVLCSEVQVTQPVYCGDTDQAGCVQDKDRVIVQQLFNKSNIVLRTTPVH